MAGYFDYVGRIFTEKGSWYKILTIGVLQGLAMLFTPKPAFQQMAQGVMPDFNLPGILLYWLATILIFGFVLQIYNGSMNNKSQLLPDLDFMDMFIKTLKLIPFWIVWVLYMGIFGAVTALLMPTLVRAGGVVGTLFFIFFAAFWIFMVLMMTVMTVIYSKDFSYKHILNPLTPLRICPKVIWPVLGFVLLLVLLNIVLYGLLFGAAMLLGVSGGETGADSTIAFGILMIIWLYIYDVFSFAYNLKFADIVKEKLGETKYLGCDFEAVPEVAESDEELDY